MRRSAKRPRPAPVSKQEPPDSRNKSEPLELEVVLKEDTWSCPICMEIAKDPVQMPCRPQPHTFCAGCLAAHLSIKAASSAEEARRNYGRDAATQCTVGCPLCRQCPPAGFVPSPASDIPARKEILVRCECGAVETLLDIRKHTDKCATVLGTSQDVAAAAAKRLSRQPPAEPTPNRATFSCPFCPQTHLPRADLLQHVQALHHNQLGRPAVCPICASMPWGSSSYRSPNFVQHLFLRHRFDYDETTAFEESEEAVLERVIRASMTDR